MDVGLLFLMILIALSLPLYLRHWQSEHPFFLLEKLLPFHDILLIYDDNSILPHYLSYSWMITLLIKCG